MPFILHSHASDEVWLYTIKGHILAQPPVTEDAPCAVDERPRGEGGSAPRCRVHVCFLSHLCSRRHVDIRITLAAGHLFASHTNVSLSAHVSLLLIASLHTPFVSGARVQDGARREPFPAARLCETHAFCSTKTFQNAARLESTPPTREPPQTTGEDRERGARRRKKVS